MPSFKYMNSKTAWFPPKIVISENIGIFWGILKMGALVKCPILYYYCVAKAPSCVRLFKFLKSDVWLKSYREICEKQFFLAGALFFVAHSINLNPTGLSQI
jgi:hypothetical protein